MSSSNLPFGTTARDIEKRFGGKEPSCHLASDECEGNCEQCPRCDRDACETHRYKEVLCLECAEAIGLIGESARLNAIRALAADELPIAEFRELLATTLIEDAFGVRGLL